MSILDRYILRQFIVNFMILFAVLFMFYCMVDLFTNLSEFFEAANDVIAETRRVEAATETLATETSGVEGQTPENDETASGDGGFMSVVVEDIEVPTSVETIAVVCSLIWQYYWPQFFLFYAYLVGLITVGACGFTLVQLHRNRELIAVMAAGVSLHRVAMPLVIAGICLNVLQFANREVILHRLAPQLLRGHSQVQHEELVNFRVSMIADGFGRVFYAREFDRATNRLQSPIIWVWDDQGHFKHRIRAEEAVWSGTGWDLINATADEASLTTQDEISDPSIAEHIETDLDPTTILMRRYGQYRQLLNLQQIGELIRKPGLYNVDDLMRIRFGRFGQFVTNILTLLIGIPLFLLREPRNVLVQSIKCAGLGMFAQIGGALTTAIGLPGIPSYVSVFVFPLLILLPLATMMVSQVET